MHISNKSSNFAPKFKKTTQNNNSKTFRIMKITLKKEQVTTVVGYEKNEDGFIISYTRKQSDRESLEIDKYDTSWLENTVRFFFVSKVQGIINNGAEIIDIEP